MSVTLSDLLGIQKKRESVEYIDRFPSYEEFRSSRNAYGLRNAEYARSDERAYARSDERADGYSRADFLNSEQYGEPRENSAAYAAEDAYAYNGFTRDAAAERLGGGYRRSESFDISRERDDFQIQNREHGVEYNGSKVKMGVSSLTSSSDYSDVQAHARRSDACLYSVRDELSAISDARYEDELFDRLAFVSPLANDHMTTSSRRIAAEQPTARRKTPKLTLKGKIILAVYIALAVLVTTLIAVNAGGLNGTADNAGAGNYVSSQSVTEVEAQATSTSATASSQFCYAEFDVAVPVTNWFDTLCDGLSSVIGD
jgi:hypothetical protein